MGWIKRNLFFVVGGLLTLALLGGAGFYIYKGWSSNSDATATLTELFNKLQEISQAPIQPGNDKIDNMQTAKEQAKQMRDWIAQARGYFQPVPPIPQGEVTSKTYATALGATIYELQQEAKASSINLPPQYNFSFQVQSTKLTISSGLGPLAQQLGEVKAITEILFAARINELEGIQRVRVSEDDATGLQSDYTDESPLTNNLAIITPYVVTFQTFSPELAKVLVGFATCTNAFIVKSVAVQPANTSGAPEAGGMMPNQYQPGQYQPGQYQPNQYQPGQYQPGQYGQYPQRYRNLPPGYPGAAQQPANEAPGSRGGLQTILKEQLLRITMEVDIVKLLPKS